MKIRHKVYLSQAFLTLLFISFSLFTYINYEKQYSKNLDEYVANIVMSKQKEFLTSLEYVAQIIEDNKKNYRQINTQALKEFNKNISLDALKEKLIKDFDIKDFRIEIYLINKDLVIYNSTFKPDIGFNLSVSVDIHKQIKILEKKNDILFAEGLIHDMLNKDYIQYSLVKLDADTYFEMAFISDRLNKKIEKVFDKKIDNKYVSNYYRINLYTEYEHYAHVDTKSQLESKKSLYSRIKKFYYNIETNDPIIKARRTAESIKMINGNKVTVISPLIDHEDTLFLNHGAVVIETIIDITQQVNTLKSFQNSFIITISLLISFLVFGFLWIKKNFTETTDTIAKNISNHKLIEDSELLDQSDEFGTIAKEYNNLLLSLNNEITKNSSLLLDNKRFISDTVHQIRTPLSVILMNSDLIKMCNNDSTIEGFLNQINSSINMLANSYEDLAYITSHDTIKYYPVNLNISKIIEERIDFFSTIVTVNSKSFSYDIQDDIYFNINQIELERIVDNNISNAIKYAESDKEVTIKLSKSNSTIVLSFSSFGEAILKPGKVFEKDYRENEEKRGLGLGLNMVKGICEKYNIEYNLTYRDGQNIFTYMFKS